MRVAVIGAGAAGLVTARELRRARHDVVVYEASNRVGGTWVYDEAVDEDPLGIERARGRAHGSMYASLRTNLPRDLMAFRDYPFDRRGGGDDDWPRFPGHREVLLYLQRFARDFDLAPMLRFGRRVESVVPVRTDGAPWHRGPNTDAAGVSWRVETRSAAGRATNEFEAVAVCNGHYSRARVPPLPGMADYQGHLMHSHNYRKPEGFTGQRVVLLGAKSSGVDLSRDIAKVADAVYLCARDHAGRRRIGPRGNIELAPALERFEGEDAVVLTDGSRIRDVDAVVFCTGYRYAFEFLPPEPGVVVVEDDWVHPLYLDLFSAHLPTLAFVGLPFMIVPFPQFELQACAAAMVWANEIELPDHAGRMRAYDEHVAALRREGRPRRHWLRHAEAQYAYDDALADLCGVARLPRWFAPLNRMVAGQRRADPDGYRDRTYPAADEIERELSRRTGPDARSARREDDR